MESLPDEILREIFSRATLSALFHAQFVDKRFYRLTFSSLTSLSFTEPGAKADLGPLSRLPGKNFEQLSQFLDRISSRVNLSRITSLTFSNGFDVSPFAAYFPNIDTLAITLNQREVINSALFPKLRHLHVQARNNDVLPYDLLLRLESLTLDLNLLPFDKPIRFAPRTDNSELYPRKELFDTLSVCTRLKKLSLGGFVAPKPDQALFVPNYSSLTNLTHLSYRFETAAHLPAFNALVLPNLERLTLAINSSLDKIPLPSLDRFCASLRTLKVVGSNWLLSKGASFSALSLNKFSLINSTLHENLSFLQSLPATLPALSLGRVIPKEKFPGLSQLCRFTALTSLNLTAEFSVSGPSIFSPFLTNLTNIRHLKLFFNPLISPKFPPTLATYTSLRTLRLLSVSLTDELFMAIGQLTDLRSLSLSYGEENTISKTCFLKALSGLAELTALGLARDKIDSRDHTVIRYFSCEEISQFCQSFPSLDRVNLRGVVKESEFERLRRELPFVSILDFRPF